MQKVIKQKGRDSHAVDVDYGAWSLNNHIKYPHLVHKNTYHNNSPVCSIAHAMHNSSQLRRKNPTTLVCHDVRLAIGRQIKKAL